MNPKSSIGQNYGILNYASRLSLIQVNICFCLGIVMGQPISYHIDPSTITQFNYVYNLIITDQGIVVSTKDTLFLTDRSSLITDKFETKELIRGAIRNDDYTYMVTRHGRFLIHKKEGLVNCPKDSTANKIHIDGSKAVARLNSSTMVIGTTKGELYKAMYKAPKRVSLKLLWSNSYSINQVVLGEHYLGIRVGTSFHLLNEDYDIVKSIDSRVKSCYIHNGICYVLLNDRLIIFKLREPNTLVEVRIPKHEEKAALSWIFNDLVVDNHNRVILYSNNRMAIMSPSGLTFNKKKRREEYWLHYEFPSNNLPKKVSNIVYDHSRDIHFMVFGDRLLSSLKIAEPNPVQTKPKYYRKIKKCHFSLELTNYIIDNSSFSCNEQYVSVKKRKGYMGVFNVDVDLSVSQPFHLKVGNSQFPLELCKQNSGE